MCILLVHVKRHESHKYPLFGLLKVTQQFKFVLSSGSYEDVIISMEFMLWSWLINASLKNGYLTITYHLGGVYFNG